MFAVVGALVAAGAAAAPALLASVGEFEAFVDAHEHALLGLFASPDGPERAVFSEAARRSDAASAEALGELAVEVLRDMRLDEAGAEGADAEGAAQRIDAGDASHGEAPLDTQSAPLAEAFCFAGWNASPARYAAATADDWNASGLAAWARAARFPNVHPLTRDSHRRLVRDSGAAVLWVFGDTEGAKIDAALARAQRCVDESGGRLGALYAPSAGPSAPLLMRTVGLDSGATLAIAIQDAPPSSTSFTFPDGAPLTGVPQFCADFLSGGLAAAPAEDEDDAMPPSPRADSDSYERRRDEL